MKSLTSSRISNCGYKLYIRVGLLNSEASKKHSLESMAKCALWEKRTHSTFALRLKIHSPYWVTIPTTGIKKLRGKLLVVLIPVVVCCHDYMFTSYGVISGLWGVSIVPDLLDIAVLVPLVF